MTITRRGLLAGILGAAAAPAIVKSDVLMPVRQLVTPAWMGMDFGEDMDMALGLVRAHRLYGPEETRVLDYMPMHSSMNEANRRFAEALSAMAMRQPRPLLRMVGPLAPLVVVESTPWKEAFK